MAGAAQDYSMVLATVGLADLESEAIHLSQTLDADGAVAQASLVRQAFLKLVRELQDIAVRIARQAQQDIRDAEVNSRVRGDTGGGGGARLGDYIGESDPLPGVEGSVGINNEQALSQSPVYWWWTNEEGYSGFIGRTIRGTFQPGSASPSPGQFRQHPLFQPGGGGKGVIRNPIPARGFVGTGAHKAEAEWHGLIRGAKGRFVAEVTRAVASAPPPVRPGAPRARRRRP